MKVVITGHTKGIGKAIYEYFLNKGYQVIGFSRSTGHDITEYRSQEIILDELKDTDIFVNNAYVNFTDDQLNLLKLSYDLWANQEKLIINISSRAAGTTDTMYGTSKLKLDHFCNNSIYKKPNILNLKFGLTDTERVKNIQGNKMSVNDFTYMLDMILNSKIKIQNITFGH